LSSTTTFPTANPSPFRASTKNPKRRESIREERAQTEERKREEEREKIG
jgi:hypothetical protein